MVVQHNISGMNANRQLNITTGVQAKSSEKLSSGYRINRAADDAAGLAISEKMRRQIRGLSQASNNAQDGVSWCQIADGALDEVSNMLSRAKELAVKAANDTPTDDDRSYINEEMQKMASEIDRTHASTEFNNIHIFSDDGFAPREADFTNSTKLSLSFPSGKKVDITFEFIGANGTKIDSVDDSQATGDSTDSYKDSDLAKFVQNAAASAVAGMAASGIFGGSGGLFDKASSSGIKVGLDLSPDKVGGTLASAKLSMQSTDSSATMSYSMFVDTKDYPINSFSSMTAEQKAKLAGVIAHEMTHLVMYDTVTDGMLSNRVTTFPSWFTEGTAQAFGGDNGWVSNYINKDSSEAAVKNYMKNVTSQPYGAGYVATMYLGYKVAQSDPALAGGVDSETIAKGLNKLLTHLALNKGETLSDAIGALTGGEYANEASFVNGFSNANSDSYNFVRTFLNNRGDNGAGSLLGNLGDPVTTVFGNAGDNPAPSTSSSYLVQTNNKWYSNGFGDGYVYPDKTSGGDDLGNLLYLQVGSETTSENEIGLKRFNVRLESLTEGSTFDTTTRDKALETIETVNIAGHNVAKVRSYYGALQNRLEHTIKNLDNVVENTQAAESRIRDTDMAAEMVRYSNNNILAQAGQSMLAQANQTNQGVLSLLQ